MTVAIILDAGPLVAYLDQHDEHHEWAVHQFGLVGIPLLSCEACITEACYILRGLPAAIEKIANYLERGIIAMDFSLAAQHSRVFALMSKYRDVPMSLADACLVCMAEKSLGGKIFTTDSDFSIYRLHGKKPVPRIAP